MTAAVIKACSGLSFSRMSLINSFSLAVIIIPPSAMRICIPIPSYFIFSQKSTNFDFGAMRKLYNGCKRKAISEFAVFIGKFTAEIRIFAVLIGKFAYRKGIYIYVSLQT